eukprot:gene14250-1456_t
MDDDAPLPCPSPSPQTGVEVVDPPLRQCPTLRAAASAAARRVRVAAVRSSPPPPARRRVAVSTDTSMGLRDRWLG